MKTVVLSMALLGLCVAAAAQNNTSTQPAQGQTSENQANAVPPASSTAGSKAQPGGSEAADPKSTTNAATSAGAPASSDVPKPEVPADIANYVIGPADVLAINVWHEPDITRSVPVRPDGHISLPLAGEVVASGLTPVQLQQSLQQKLSDKLINPVVTVTVEQFNSHKFNIVGEVAKPGAYDLLRPMTVLDALALAGGFRDFAKTKGIYVLRKQADGTTSKLKFNYKDVIKGKNTAQNVPVMVGDTIVVP